MNKRMAPPDYFVSPVPGIWSLAEDGEAIMWRDSDATALMLVHLQKLLQPLAKQLNGLPSLTAVIFIVEALSKGWSESIAEERLRRLMEVAGRSDEVQLQKTVHNWLWALEILGPEFRQGYQAHAAFLVEVLEQLPREWLANNKAQADQSLSWLENVLGDRGSLFSARLIEEKHATWLALTTLDFASMNGLNIESLRLRLRTGLDRLPANVEFEHIERFPLAAMVTELATQNDDLGTLARMAVSISSTLSLPRQPSDPDALPIGGVSDVTNRGAPDRLLLSELALDSDLLIARIANGQALYLRREQPPQPQIKQRTVLIESGIRMWGTMRLYASAVALGLCLSQERRGGQQMQIVTVAGANAWLEDFTTTEGLTRHFQRLNAEVHPGQAIADLPHRSDIQLELDNEPVIIVSAGTDRDPSFQQMVRELPTPHMVARVDLEGSVELLQRSSLGDMRWQRIVLDSAVQAVENQKPVSKNLPLFFSQPAGLLRYAVSHVGKWSQAFHEAGQSRWWTVTDDRRVMLFDRSHCGAIEVGSIPAGKILASEVIAPDTWLLVVEIVDRKAGSDTHQLIEANVVRGIREMPMKLKNERPSRVSYCFDRGQLIRIGKKITFIDTRSGADLATTDVKFRHLGGALFGYVDLWVASLEHDSIQWNKLNRAPSPVAFAGRLENGMPVVYGHDLSWMMQLTGDDPKPQSTGTKIISNSDCRVVRANSRGTELLVSIKGVTSSTDPQLICNGKEEKLVAVSLVEPKVRYLALKLPDALVRIDEANCGLNFRSIAVRRRATGLTFGKEAMLLNVNNDRFGTRIIYGSVPPGMFSIEDMYPRGDAVKDTGEKYAKWKLYPIPLRSGKAWFDSRGLLHLRHPDGSELTLVLSADTRLAGWHSRGLMFGPKYFTGRSDCPESMPTEIIEWLQSLADEQ